MNTRSDGEDVVAAGAAATRAAKAAFVHVTEDQLLCFLNAQADVEHPVLLSFEPVTSGAGASNGIVLFRLRRQVDGQAREEDLVLRYSPGVQLIKQKSYAAEFQTLTALGRFGLPAPRPRWLDGDGSVLGCPGYVMERVVGRAPEAAMLASGLLAEATPEARKAMMLSAAGFHGRLRRAAIGPEDVPHLVNRGEGETAVEREVNWWLAEARLAASADDPKLVYLEELGAWMRAHQPQVRPATLVHGDAQIANVMFHEGELAAVVDWELSYLGHNEADLALILFLATTHGAGVPDMEGLPTRAEYVARYEEEAGGAAEHLEYFSVLNFIKMLAIYLMLGDKLPGLEEIWRYHEGLADAARVAAAAVVVTGEAQP